MTTDGLWIWQALPRPDQTRLAMSTLLALAKHLPGSQLEELKRLAVLIELVYFVLGIKDGVWDEEERDGHTGLR